MDWRTLLEFPWEYPDHFLVAAVDEETGEAGVFICSHGGHGWLYPTPFGPQDLRTGLPHELDEMGWRAYAWSDGTPPAPEMGDVVVKPSGPLAFLSHG